MLLNFYLTHIERDLLDFIEHNFNIHLCINKNKTK